MTKSKGQTNGTSKGVDIRLGGHDVHPQAVEGSLRQSVPRVARLRDLLDDWESDALEAHEARRDGRLRGPITGLRKFDMRLGGFIEPGLHAIHGNTGAGKTALALQVAACCGFPALYVSCEMRPLELARRITARVTGTFLGKLKSGELRPEGSRAMFSEACKAAPNLAIVDLRGGAASPEWLCEAAAEVRGDEPHLLVVIDSLHSWTDMAHPDAIEYEALSQSIAGLQSVAAALQAPVLVIAEQNRASMGKGGVNAGAGNRRIEYRAESVWDLSRDPNAEVDDGGEVLVSVGLVKNRNGSIGEPVLMQFNGALQRFREVGK